MDFQGLLAKTPVTLEQLRNRVFYALQRHPLCRGIEFDVVSTPRTRRTNWTISLRSVQPGALWEAHEIIADIQEAYELAVPA
ncbi:hypothetical protein [Bradyrhizobium lablabi]|uniref:hypothetical protein n=1 Tax=Bradyrhizobium lablabi TaxID=722472 RepID=UPI001BAC1D1A|nr:hypothetical protein [Bradyrhizobium lablabi]MBR0696630.1 hypothetical protein [Bradyrhizobium lablabi]